MDEEEIEGDSRGVSKKLLFFLIPAVIVVAAVIVFIFLGRSGASDFYGDTDGDGIINGNDPDANGDGIMENFPSAGGGGGSGGSGGAGGGATGDIDGDGTPNVNDTDIDGDGTPNGSDPDPGNSTTPNPPENTTDGEEIGEASCENYRVSMGMDQAYFSLDFSNSQCLALATSTCNYGDAFTDNYIWNNQLKCCVWKCTFEP